VGWGGAVAEWTTRSAQGMLGGVAESGAYRASRAAALSGIPERTVHDWAQEGIVVPSVSSERVMLWSFADLIALRIVAWLRGAKATEQGPVPAVPMKEVRRALATLRGLDLDVWSAEEGSRLVIDSGGQLVVRTAAEQVGDQLVLRDTIDLVAPFQILGDLCGPDLRRPRPSLRIIPSKLGGEPHVDGTRLESRAVASLARRGFSLRQLHDFYPFAATDALEECIQLETQLQQNGSEEAA
jgi:uncharacterized protein (DUF433 family)/DNA-binding transcriptional MerR regulator